MSGDLTLIESDILDELLEKAIVYDILAEQGNLMFDMNLPEFTRINTQIKTRKDKFLSNYVNIPLVEVFK